MVIFMSAPEALLLQNRNYQRYKIKERAQTLFDVAIPFHIIDISLNGLSFRYVGNAKWFPDPRSIDIIYDSFSLKKIPVKTVSDEPIQSDLVQMRRHSVQFNNLSDDELNKLTYFIENCAA